MNGVLPPDDPETRAAYEMTHAAQNGTASPEVQARWDENMANRVASPDEFGLTRHGTVTGYRQGCRGEACPESPSCRDVAREYQREYRRKQRGVGEFEHGTTTGYYSRKCRCDSCREAMREYSREYRRKRREGAGAQSSRGFTDADLKPAPVTIPDARHGTPTGYVKGCRCDSCRTAMREYQREYRKRKRAEKAAGRAQQSGDPGLARDGFAAFPWEIETN